jgi:periplasmic protein TonB
MVLVQSAPQSLLSRVHPNPARVFGIAGAIALNIALLMALLMPMQSAPPAPAIEDVPYQWVLPLEKEKKPDPPPERVPVVKRNPEQPKPEALPKVEPKPESPPVVFNDSTPMDVTPESTTDPRPATDPAVDTGPVAGVRLEYASAPPPPYPREQVRSGTQGTVLLRVLVDLDGKPLDVTIHKSSGNRDLDRAAQRHILRNWTFRPAMKDGRPIQAIGIVPIDFKLQ